jgi:hypothetical protein
MKRLFKWIDGLYELTPKEKAERELKETQVALLESKSHLEFYQSQVTIFSAREKRLTKYLNHV